MKINLLKLNRTNIFIFLLGNSTFTFASDRKIRSKRQVIIDGNSLLNLIATKGIEFVPCFEIKLGSTLEIQTGEYDYTIQAEDLK